jgi:hypothetical protein
MGAAKKQDIKKQKTEKSTRGLKGLTIAIIQKYFFRKVKSGYLQS